MRMMKIESGGTFITQLRAAGIMSLVKCIKSREQQHLNIALIENYQHLNEIRAIRYMSIWNPLDSSKMFLAQRIYQSSC